MPKDQPVKIPLSADEAVSDLLKVKPTAEMPRPGTRRGKAKPKGAKKRRK